MTGIITAVISAAVTLSVCLLNNHFQKRRDDRAREAEKRREEIAREERRQQDVKEREVEKEKYMADIMERVDKIMDEQHDLALNIHNDINILQFKVETLSKHVEKHNSVIERTYELEKASEVHEEKIRVANHRIEDLERMARQ